MPFHADRHRLRNAERTHYLCKAVGKRRSAAGNCGVHGGSAYSRTAAARSYNDLTADGFPRADGGGRAAAGAGVRSHVLLSSKTVYIIATMLLGRDFLLGTVGDLTKYLYTVMLYNCKADLVQGGQPYICLSFALLIYVVLPTVISVVGFRKKELEF